jgi:hypothetical protein
MRMMYVWKLIVSFFLVGVGDVETAAALVAELISQVLNVNFVQSLFTWPPFTFTVYYLQGADVSLRCRWTDMLPLHYATFFNAAPVIRVLLKASGSKGAALTFYFSLTSSSFGTRHRVCEND